MNDKRRLCLVAGGVIAILMVLFPPFHIVQGEHTANVGYGFIATPPNYYASVNVLTLAVQIFGLAIAVAVVWYVLGKNGNEK